MKNKNKNQYGTFVTKKAWYLRRKTITVAGISAVALCLAIFFGLQLFKHDKNKQLSLEIPQAVASEMPGWWYKDYFGSSVCEKDECQPDADPDRDKLTNAQEFFYHSNPLNRDTNSNGLSDGEDVAHNYDSSKPGRVTFEQAASDESVLGESLVFGDDVKKILNETIDPNKITLRLVSESELTIGEDNSKEAVAKYLEESSKIMDKYFPKQVQDSIRSALENQDIDTIDEIKLRSVKALVEVKKLPTPRVALDLHKYTLAFLDLVPKVVSVPPPDLLGNELNAVGNRWFDNVQAFSMVNQKMNIEISKLKTKI